MTTPAANASDAARRRVRVVVLAAALAAVAGAVGWWALKPDGGNNPTPTPAPD
ncbi:MAG: hypothetical protein JOY78_02580, partial [Pseudonocardia sp.]|nr:hypothetical protein [Pseudonocardia sp.]